MPLIQLHWQWIKNGNTVKTEVKAMQDINSDEEMQNFIKETNDEYSLPEDVMWLVVFESSKYFVQMNFDKER